MFSPRFLLRNSIPIARSPRAIRLPKLQPLLRFLRNSSSVPKPLNLKPVTPKPGSNKILFPERIIIFHAGTGKTTFLGCLKISTVFLFGAFALILVPAQIDNEEQPKWMAPAVLVAGLIPLLFVAYATDPFVANMSLRLPHFVRGSKALLLRYSKNVPPNAALEITTIGFIGTPRTTRVLVSELYPVTERLGMVNFKRDVSKINRRRKWYMPKALGVFWVYEGSKPINGEIWGNVKECIERHAAARKKV